MVDKSPRQAFFHLRLHSEFSINDGLVTITSLIEKLKYFGMPAVAITDFANLFALIKFYSAAIKSGIKPICGCDVLVENCDGVRSKIVLLASSNIGYLNLTSLISGIYTEASDARETVISQSKLNKHTEGLIALSGAQYSDVGVALLEGNLEQAEKYLQVWKTMFPNAFYLEVQRLGKVGEEQYIAGLIELAIESKTPVVATNDVRFISQDDFEAHEVRVCINEGRTLDDPRRTRDYTSQQYLKSSSEMSQLFCDLPAAIANTVEIVKRCNLELKLGTPHLPRYPVPEGETLENYLSELSQNGLKKRLEHLYGDESKTEEILIPYRKRLNQEIEIINRMGFAGYFLIVMEFIQWAKSSEIPVGPGRGSGAGSLVAYALEITDLDPLKYDLLFERFLNPERVSMPDFDIDFCNILSAIKDDYEISLFTFLIIPILNPDGAFNFSRYNHNGVDLNRDWSAYNQKEIKTTVDFISKTLRKNKSNLILGLDFHSTYYDVFYTNIERSSTSMPLFLDEWFLSLENSIPNLSLIHI